MPFNSFATDLVTVLIEDDVVEALNTDAYIGTRVAIPMLSSGRATVQVIEYPGTGNENTHNATLRPAFLQPRAQVVARADTYQVAYDMAMAAYNSLFGIRNRFINSGWYQRVTPLQPPFDLGLDDRKQSKVAFNVAGKYNKRG